MNCELTPRRPPTSESTHSLSPAQPLVTKTHFLSLDFLLWTFPDGCNYVVDTISSHSLSEHHVPKVHPHCGRWCSLTTLHSCMLFHRADQVLLLHWAGRVVSASQYQERILSLQLGGITPRGEDGPGELGLGSPGGAGWTPVVAEGGQMWVHSGNQSPWICWEAERGQ